MITPVTDLSPKTKVPIIYEDAHSRVKEYSGSAWVFVENLENEKKIRNSLSGSLTASPEIFETERIDILAGTSWFERLTPESYTNPAPISNLGGYSYGLFADIRNGSTIVVKSHPPKARLYIDNSRLLRSIDDIFAIARFIEFEDGMDNEFAYRLTRLVQIYGSSAVNALDSKIKSNDIPHDITAMTLRYLGEIEQPETADLRLSILIRSLQHPSPKVRDGAALGIGSIAMPVAIPALAAAIDQENISVLRKSMQLTLRELKGSK